MGRPETLFNVDVFNDEQIRIGVTPNSHVLHVLEEKGGRHEGDEIKLEYEQDMKNNFSDEVFTSGYGQVSHAEIFYNAADLKTREHFIYLMRTSEKYYKQNFGAYDNKIKDFLDIVRDYVCSSTRHGQQDALLNMQFKIAQIVTEIQKDSHALKQQADKLGGENKLSKKDQDKIDDIKNVLDMIDIYKKSLLIRTMGNLKIDENINKNLPTAEEPIITFLGRRPIDFAPGNWEPTNDVLFPHEPSPNDVKQGVGLQSCYMLSALTALASKNPEKIREAMKDNGDGTVTVRFFETEYNKETKETTYTPVYIKVNKTANRSFFNNNIYASSAVWVQMLEKAYAEFLTMEKRKTEANPDIKTSMKIADTGDSAAFMTSMLGENMNYMNLHVNNFPYYEINKKAELINHPPYYLPEEKAIFKVLENAVNKRKEAVTAAPVTLVGSVTASCNNVGIRTNHKYAVTKVFTKTVAGKEVYFVQVRDPYACFELKYDQNGGHKESSNLEVINANRKAGLENMGTFNVELKDFIALFGTGIGNISDQTALEMNEAYKKFRCYTTPFNLNYEDKDHPIMSVGFPLTDDEMKSEENYDNSHEGTLVEYEQQLVSANKSGKPQIKPDGEEYSALDELEIKESDFIEPKKEEQKEPSSLDEYEMKDEDFIAPEEEFEEIKYNPEMDEDVILANSLDDETIFNITQNLARSRSELQATDEFYVLSNTQPFKDMKKYLEDLSDELLQIVKQKDIKKSDFIGDIGDENNYKKDEKFSYKEKKEIANKLNTLRNLATIYTDKKYNAITSPNVKSSDYSERAISRFAIGTDIKNICKLDYPQSESPRKSAELLALFYVDLMRNMSALHNKTEQINDGIIMDEQRKLQLSPEKKLEETINSIKETKAFFEKNTTLKNAVREIINSKKEYKEVFDQGEEDYELETNPAKKSNKMSI